MSGQKSQKVNLKHVRDNRYHLLYNNKPIMTFWDDGEIVVDVESLKENGLWLIKNRTLDIDEVTIHDE